MLTWLTLAARLRGALLLLLALAQLPRHAFDSTTATTSNAAAAGCAGELALDVDGDGRADRVSLRRYGDDDWLDVALAADGFAVRSSTRVVPGAGWSLAAADLDGDGRGDVILRDGDGRAVRYVSDGLAFSQVPVANSTTE